MADIKIGPHSDATVAMIGNYAGVPCRYTSPLEGIGSYAKTVHQKGCMDMACRGDLILCDTASMNAFDCRTRPCN